MFFSRWRHPNQYKTMHGWHAAGTADLPASCIAEFTIQQCSTLRLVVTYCRHILTAIVLLKWVVDGRTCRFFFQIDILLWHRTLKIVYVVIAWAYISSSSAMCHIHFNAEFHIVLTNPLIFLSGILEREIKHEDKNLSSFWEIRNSGQALWAEYKLCRVFWILWRLNTIQHHYHNVWSW